MTFIVSDGTYTSTPAARQITVIAVNDLPVNSVPGAQVVNEDTTQAIAGVSVGDVDSNLTTVQLGVVSGTLNVSLAGGATISAGANGTGTLTLAGSQTQINTALASLTYRGNANFAGADTLTVLSTDAGGLSDSDTVAITVAGVNDAPGVALPSTQNTRDQHIPGAVHGQRQRHHGERRGCRNQSVAGDAARHQRQEHAGQHLPGCRPWPGTAPPTSYSRATSPTSTMP